MKNTFSVNRYGVFKVHAGDPADEKAGQGPVSQNSTAWTSDEVDVVLGTGYSDGRVRLLRVARRLQMPRPIDEPSAYRSNRSGIPRKEVIQPQLPLRLPCYDFTPIIDPTFDGSLPCGLGHRLRVLPTFVV